MCIIGAGPAGATASLFLSQQGIDHILIDKCQFPRNKVCGDALTIEVMHTLKRLNPHILQSMIERKDFLPVWQVKGFPPSCKESLIPFDKDQMPYAPFFTTRRSVFDSFLLESNQSEHVQFLDNTNVTDIKKADEMILSARRSEESLEVHCSLVLGADGSNSIVGRRLAGYESKDFNHTYASVRTYFKLKHGTCDSLEFYFLKELLPGYLWIFPMPDGSVNVGLVMLSKQVKKAGMKIREKFFDLLNNHPQLKNRFQGAEQLEKLQGWDLPLNSKRKKLSGDNYLLLGDAGSMIEPFSGKGIGIGMMAGMIATETAVKAIEANRFDEAFLMHYHDAVYQRFHKEWRFLYRLQQWYHHPARVNLLGSIYDIPWMKRFVNRKFQEAILKWM